jgi:hypothetical protein
VSQLFAQFTPPSDPEIRLSDSGSDVRSWEPRIGRLTLSKMNHGIGHNTYILIAFLTPKINLETPNKVEILKNDVIREYKKIEDLFSKSGFDLSRLPEQDENLLHEEVEKLERKIEELKELQKTNDLSEVFNNKDIEMAIFLLDFGNLMEDFGNFFDYMRITENGGKEDLIKSI